MSQGRIQTQFFCVNCGSEFTPDLAQPIPLCGDCAAEESVADDPAASAAAPDADEPSVSQFFCVNCGTEFQPESAQAIPICGSCAAAAAAWNERSDDDPAPTFEEEALLPAIPAVAKPPPAPEPPTMPPMAQPAIAQPVPQRETAPEGLPPPPLATDADAPPPVDEPVRRPKPTPIGRIGAPREKKADEAERGPWRIKKANGRIYGPFDFETVTRWITEGKITALDQIISVGGTWKRASQHQHFTEVFQNQTRNTAGSSSSRRWQDFVDPDTTPGRITLISGGSVLVLAVVLLVVFGIDWKSRFGPGPDLTDDRLAALSARYPNATGDPAQLIERANAALEADTVTAFDRAREPLEIALAVAPENPEALGRLAEVYGLLAWYDAREDLLQDGLLFAQRAVARAPELPGSHRAHATVLLARRKIAGNVEEANVAIGAGLAIAPNDAGLLVLAGVASRASDPVLAARLLAKASATDPKLVRSHLEAADLALQQRSFFEAVRTLERIRKRSFLAEARLGEAYESLGRFNDARRAYETAAAAPEASNTWKTRTALRAAVIEYQILGRTSAALRRLDAIPGVRHGDPTPDSELWAAVHLHRAAALRRAGKNADAVEAANIARSTGSRHDTAARLQLGLALSALGKHADAEAAMKEGTPPIQKGDRARWGTSYGRILAAGGDKRGAETQFEETLRLDKSHTPALFSAALLRTDRNGKDRGGISQLLDAPAPDPLSDSTRLTELFTGYEIEIYRAAARRFAVVKRTYPDSPAATRALGIAQFYAGQRSAARSSFRRAAKEEAGEDDLSALYLALDQQIAGNCKKALKTFQSVDTTDLRTAPVLATFARCEARAGNNKAAKRLFNEAIRDDPNYAPALYWFGDFQNRTGKRTAALDSWKRSLEKDRGFYPAAMALYRAQARRG